MTSGGYIIRKGSDPERDPIELIHSEHLMMREVLDAIDRLVLEPSDNLSELAQEPYSYLRDEYVAHHLDEDEAMFPLLRQRAEPEDRIEETLDRLEADHENGHGQIDRVLTILKAMVDGNNPPDGDGFETLRFFAAAERRHLIIENAIVLPIARARLSKADLDTIYRMMLARRGFDRVMKEADRAKPLRRPPHAAAKD